MPYKSEKIRIANTQYDRRVKLTQEQREDILRLYMEGNFTYRQLANKFSVSSRTIYFICNPESYEMAKQQFRIRSKEGRYKITKEERNALIKEHRHYKQQLYISGKIK